MVEESLEEIIDMLLQYADPEGDVHEKLVKAREKISRGVVPGVKTVALITKLRTRMDNIECRHLRYDGMCLKLHKKCDHRDKFRACLRYEAPKPSVRGELMQLGG